MLNLFQIIGHVGQDADIFTFPNGDQVAHFSVATTEPATTTSKGQVIPERTTWHRVNIYGQLAKSCAESIKKGTKLYCSGMLIQREYATRSTGEIKTVMEMECRYLEFLSPKQETPVAAPEPPAETAPAPAASEITTTKRKPQTLKK